MFSVQVSASLFLFPDTWHQTPKILIIGAGGSGFFKEGKTSKAPSGVTQSRALGPSILYFVLPHFLSLMLTAYRSKVYRFGTKIISIRRF